MEVVRLHFPEAEAPPLRLLPGAHDIGWEGESLRAVTEPVRAVLRVNVGRRGIWMRVLQESVCVHVNARRVYQIALLRCGDVVHVEMQALRLIAWSPPEGHENSGPGAGAGVDPRWVLRAHGGQYHGRCFRLDRPQVIGRGAKADIRLDDANIRAEHIRLQRQHDQVLLHALEGETDCMVNGHRCRDAVLHAGDQLLLGSGHRFVLEAPLQAGSGLSPAEDVPTRVAISRPQARSRPVASPLRSLTWLLVSAMALAAILAGVLLFGTG